jgi:CDP-diglyceride synthetase
MSLAVLLRQTSLRSTDQPEKTWEGFIGALFTSLLCSYWMYALMPEKLSAFRFGDLTFLGLLLGFAAIVGDLAESIVKRGAHTKDSSSMLPASVAHWISSTAFFSRLRCYFFTCASCWALVE